MKPRLLIDMRADCRHVLDGLKEDFDIIALAPTTAIGDPPVWRGADPTDRTQEALNAHWPSVAGAVAFVQTLDPKPVAAIFWQTVLPLAAAAALACRERGIPTYEINHSRIATYQPGHFECGSLADHVVCSDHFADFLKTNGCYRSLRLGQPAYDCWPPRAKEDVRAQLNVPPGGFYVLKCSTWIHGYSEWSCHEYFEAHEMAIVKALVRLQQKMGITVLWSTRGKVPDWYREKLGNNLMQHGFDPGGLLITDDEPIKDLVDASDLVISQKSGVAVDAVMSKRRSVMADFRPLADEYVWPNKGVTMARSPDQLLAYCEGMLGGEYDAALEKEWADDARTYWGGTGDAGDQLIGRIHRHV